MTVPESKTPENGILPRFGHLKLNKAVRYRAGSLQVKIMEAYKDHLVQTIIFAFALPAFVGVV
jgi:hypothetical protein